MLKRDKKDKNSKFSQFSFSSKNKRDENRKFSQFSFSSKNKRDENRKFSQFSFSSKNKKGSHVGMMLSFAVFVTFIVFLYNIVSPAVKASNTRDYTLNDAVNKIIEYTSSNLTIASVQIDENTINLHRCLFLEDFSGKTGIVEDKIITKDAGGDKKPSRLEGEKLNLNRETTGGSVVRVDVNDGGSGYTTSSDVTIGIPDGGEGTRAIAEIKDVSATGEILSIKVTYEGGYYDVNHAPDVTIYGGNGEASATAVVRGNTFFKIYSSPEFSESEIVNCESEYRNINANKYSIGNIMEDSYVFEKKMDDMLALYGNPILDDTGYNQLKNDLDLIPGAEFAIQFADDDENSPNLWYGEAPDSAEVYADSIPIQYITQTADIKSGFINIKIW